MTLPLRLGVNIDHVATVRNARGGGFPDPLRAARIAADAGADGITAHLREDRRHISDRDIERLAAEIPLPLNFELAMTAEMQRIALGALPHAVCVVPERRAEITTEGGLDAAGRVPELREFIAPLAGAGARVSLFIDAEPAQVEAAREVGAEVVEFHTGAYCHAHAEGDLVRRDAALEALRRGVAQAASLGLEVHAGHGLGYGTVAPVAAMADIAELNIGHFLVGEAIFVGLAAAIREMRRRMDAARAGAGGAGG